MTFLTSAIIAEVAGDYGKAVAYYRKMARQGSLLDRIGIFQAIARCSEKTGLLKRAAHWHERAGRGYMQLPSRVMGTQEKAYYALVEFRSALQDYVSGTSMRRAAKLYLNSLRSALRQGRRATAMKCSSLDISRPIWVCGRRRPDFSWTLQSSSNRRKSWT